MTSSLTPFTANAVPPEMPEATAWHGKLDLHYSLDRHAPELRTRLSRSRSQAPLKVQRPFYPESHPATRGLCHTVALHTAGGIVGGDRLEQTIALEPQTQALISTPAAAKVYGSRSRSRQAPQGVEAQQFTHVDLQPEAYLEYLPQDTIIFNGAVFRQNLRVDLAPGAIWCGWEVVRLGRTARGEAFTVGTWRSRTEVWQMGRPLWLDRQVWHGEPELGLKAKSELESEIESELESETLPEMLPDAARSYHGLNQQPIVGTFLWQGSTISPDVISEVRSLWQAIEANHRSSDAPNAEAQPPATAGVSATIQGLVCRYRGRSSSKVRHWFTAVWHLLRHSQRGYAPCFPRIW